MHLISKVETKHTIKTKMFNLHPESINPQSSSLGRLERDFRAVEFNTIFSAFFEVATCAVAPTLLAPTAKF